jgi:hypothetical protein
MRQGVEGLLLGLYEDDNQPMLFTLEGQLFIPLFTTPEKYEEAKRTACANIRRPIKLKVITDHNEFLDSIPDTIRIMVDPWATDRGTTRWTEIWRD